MPNDRDPNDRDPNDRDPNDRDPNDRDQDKERVSLAGMDPEEAIRGLLAVDAFYEMPDFSDVYVPERKLRDYLLSATHKQGRHKLRLFQSVFGIGPDDQEQCAEMLIEATRNGTVEDVRDRSDCRVYAIRSVVAGLDGLDRDLRICWKVPHDGGRPAFVTAYLPDR